MHQLILCFGHFTSPHLPPIHRPSASPLLPSLFFPSPPNSSPSARPIARAVATAAARPACIPLSLASPCGWAPLPSIPALLPTRMLLLPTPPCAPIGASPAPSPAAAPLAQPSSPSPSRYGCASSLRVIPFVSPVCSSCLPPFAAPIFLPCRTTIRFFQGRERTCRHRHRHRQTRRRAVAGGLTEIARSSSGCSNNAMASACPGSTLLIPRGCGR